MLFPEFDHVEISLNGANNRNQVIKVSDLSKTIPTDGQDHYIVFFRYKAELKQYVTDTGSVKGHDFEHHADFITFDIDDKDLSVAQTSAIALTEKLIDLGIGSDLIQLSFSGAKGFHVQVPSSLFGITPSKYQAKSMKNLCQLIADGIPLDLNIYDKNRLFRARNTKNSKSGLYKVNITANMLMQPLGMILDYAKQPQEKIIIRNNHKPQDNLVALWQKTNTVKQRDKVLHSPSNIEVPKHSKACIHRILQGVPNGHVHNSAFRLANHFYKQGFPANVIAKLLEGWGPLNEVAADEDFDRMAAEAGEYDFGCNDEILKTFCSDQCYLFKRATVDASEILDLKAQYEAYQEYVKTLAQKCFVTGFTELDDAIRGVAPGEVMMICAYSGLFKSALLQNLLLGGCKRSALYHLFFSLEMPVSRVFERSAQMTCDEYGYTIENNFNNPEFHTRIYERMVIRGADKLLVCQKSGISIEQVIEYTKIAKEKYGDIGAIGIDYLGLMSAPGKQDEYSRISYCAEQSKHLAKSLNIPVIMLTQINRAAVGTDVEKWSAKGSGAIEASADFMIGLQKDESEQLLLRLLKNRKGRENLDFEVDMERDYLKFLRLRQVERVKTKKGKTQEPPCPF